MEPRVRWLDDPVPVIYHTWDDVRRKLDAADRMRERLIVLRAGLCLLPGPMLSEVGAVLDAILNDRDPLA